MISVDTTRHINTGEPKVFIPEELKISVYPNPFNAVTTISFSLARESLVTLNVFDVTGRLVRELVNGKMQAGEHQVEFNGKNLTSGIYFARVETGRGQGQAAASTMRKTVKMVVMK